VRERSEILRKDYWSKPTSNGSFIWNKYFQYHHVKKPQWSPFKDTKMNERQFGM
jgi:hypothetical protein